MKKRIPVIILILMVLFTSCGVTPPSNSAFSNQQKNFIKVPDIEDTEIEIAKTVLAALGLVPLVTEEYSDVTEQGKVIGTEPAIASEVAPGSRVTIVISKGAQQVRPKGGNWYAWWVSGSQEDNYIIQSTYIEGSEMLVKMQVTYNSNYPMTWIEDTKKGVGYGNASTNDSFSEKVVPVTVIYENEIITKGTPQNVELRIPLDGLGTNRPLKIYSQLATNINGNFEYIRIDFTFNW